MQDTNKLNSLIDLASILGHQSDFQELLRIIAQKSAELVKADIASVMTLTPFENNTVKTIFNGEVEISNKKFHLLQSTINDWVIDNNLSFITNDIHSDQRFQKNLFKDIEIKSAIGIPLNADIKILGILLVLNQKTRKTFINKDLETLEKLTDIVTPFLQNSQRIRELENSIERKQTLTAEDSKSIATTPLPVKDQRELQDSEKGSAIIHAGRPLNESLAKYEEKLIRNVLIDCNWNQSKAARLLQISEHAIRYKMQKLGIKKP